MQTNSVVPTDPELPFKLYVSFEKVFAVWEDMLENGNVGEQENARLVLDHLSKYPILRKPLTDFSLLDKYEAEIALLFSPLFPKALQLNEIKSCTLPFRSVFFNRTKRFENILLAAGEDYEFSIRHFDTNHKYLAACSYILNVHYGTDILMNSSTILDIPVKKANTYRTYRGFFNADFNELKSTPNSPALSEEDIAELLNNADDLALWKKKIPPNSFEMHGFGLLTIFDITADDALSTVKDSLIKKDALTSPEILSELQQELRRYFAVEDLQIGFATLAEKQLHTVGGIGSHSILVSDEESIHPKEAFCDVTYQKIFKHGRTVSIPRISDLADGEGAFVQQLRRSGLESYMVCPLIYDQQMIGYIELGSKKKYVLNSVAELKLIELVPLFATALKRSIDEYNVKLDALIKEKCTSIHSSVEWRFYQAARNLLKTGAPQEAEMEEIVFEKVYPLFGQMDIRRSSLFRDQGISEDLETQLSLAKNVLVLAGQQEDIFIYDHLIFTIDEFQNKIKHRLDAGDESRVLEFLNEEIEPVFAQLADRDASLKEMVAAYLERIDPKIKRVYEGRKKYEDTVTVINEEISSLMEKAQNEAQAMFPHYFEKYKTDGVEYNMYLGQSLLDDGAYHEMYLKNLRLWQLITTCDIECTLHAMSSGFLVPLQIASLILVQDTPIDIRFRQDEKKFDVDGAYNVRYEIIKKRIDKSKVRDRDERLTQPGKLAIVYSNNNEAKEYQKYLEYLMARSYLTGEVEHLELEELEGASGLKALRVAINLERSNSDISVSDQQVRSLLESID